MLSNIAKNSAVDKQIVTLIRCTRRKLRPKSITEVASIIEYLRKKLGSYKAVGEAASLSTEMLREFRSVNLLHPDIKSLVEERVIDSVDFVYRISKLDTKGQKAIVRRYLKDELSGDDVRTIKSFKRANSNSTRRAISKIMKSRDVKTYLVKFEIPEGKGKRELRNRFEEVIGENAIVSFRLEGGIGTLGLSYRGQKELREAAKKQKKTPRRLVMDILGENPRRGRRK